MSNVFYCSQTRSLVSDLNFLMYRTHASNINYIQLLLNALNVECVLSQPNQNISILVQSLNGLNLTTFCKFNYIWSITLSISSTMQSRVFFVDGPLVWNSLPLPLALRSLPRVFSQK